MLLLRPLSGARVKYTLALLTFVLLCLGYVLQAVGIHLKYPPPESGAGIGGNRQGRDLMRVSTAEDDAAENEVQRHYDIPKLRPNIPSLALARTMLLNGSLMNHDPLRHIKSSLKDARFREKLREMEAKRQSLYLKLLRDRGQVVSADGGGEVIVSSPQVVVKMPNTLKGRRVEDWTEREQIWRNITHFPWALDDACKEYAVTFAPTLHQLPIVGLASYPSSGNTWLRYLIEGSTGVFTGSMYNDIMLVKKGFYGEAFPPDSGLTVVVKSHGHTTGKAADMPRKQQKEKNHVQELNRTAVLLVRNPFKAIIGHRNLDDGGHTGYAKEERFEGKGWDDFVRKKIAAWENFYLDWLETPATELLVVHYEDLRDNLEEVLSGVLDFLDVEAEEGRLMCTIKQSEGEFHRKREKAEAEGEEKDNKKPPPKDPYTAEQRALVRDAIVRVDKAFRENGHDPLPTDKYELMTPSS